MRFVEPGRAIDAAELTEIESRLGLTFPMALRETYLAANGGCPEPYVYNGRHVETVVSELLPLISDEHGTAVQTYERLVRRLRLVPDRLFPFAVDGGGDYFFVDCAHQEGRVFFYRSDTACDNKLLDLGVGLAEFWAGLEEEEGNTSVVRDVE